MLEIIFDRQIKMQQNIKNAEENIQHENQRMRRQENVNQQQGRINLNVSYIQHVNHHKIQYMCLFLLLLEVIITTVLLVLFITLKYIGFVGWQDNPHNNNNKISLTSLSNCKDEYMINQNEFIVTKIKTAFISLSLQFAVAFLSGVLLFIMVVKSKKYRQRSMISHYNNLKPALTALYILLSADILLNVIMFGTYLNFTIKANTNSNLVSQQCKLNIVNKQIVAITILLGVKLLLYLILWTFILCKIGSENNNYQLHSDQKLIIQDQNQNQLQNQNEINKKSVSNPKFPEIREFKSVIEYHFPQDKHNQLKTQNENKIDDQIMFKALKTEDFIIQSHNGNIVNENHQVRLFMLKEEDKIIQRETQPIKEDQQSHRRLIIYEPEDNERFIQTKKYLNSNQIQMTNNQITITKRKHKHTDDISVNKSEQKDQNLLLLINSVNRGPQIDQIPIQPQSSKQKTVNQFQSSIKSIQKNLFKQNQRKHSFQLIKNNFPPPKSQKSQKKGMEMTGNNLSRKNIFPNQPASILKHNNDINKHKESEKGSVNQIKSIIMKLNEPDE